MRDDCHPCALLTAANPAVAESRVDLHDALHEDDEDLGECEAEVMAASFWQPAESCIERADVEVDGLNLCARHAAQTEGPDPDRFWDER